MKARYLYRILYSLIIAHMVHKIYCRATAKYHVPLIAILLGMIGIDLSIKPVRYDEDGDVVYDDDDNDGEYDRRRQVVRSPKPAHPCALNLLRRRDIYK